MDSLFAQPQKKPLADRMRPTRLSDFVGQETAVGERSPLRRMIEKDQLQSVLFYGPPGTGKTTLAQVIAHMTGDEFVAINAVSSGVPELRLLRRRSCSAAGWGALSCSSTRSIALIKLSRTYCCLMWKTVLSF